MNRRLSARIILITVVAGGVAAAACSSSNTTGPGLDTKALVGTWALDTLPGPAGPVTPPNVNGTLQLTDKTYKVHVTAGSATLTADSGTYSVNGSTFTEVSLTGLPSVTATASIRGRDTLDVKVTSPAQAAGLYVWVRHHS